MKVYKVKNPHDEVVDSYQYSEDEKCKQYVSNKIDIEPNATVELQYQVGVKTKRKFIFKYTRNCNNRSR